MSFRIRSEVSFGLGWLVSIALLRVCVVCMFILHGYGWTWLNVSSIKPSQFNDILQIQMAMSSSEYKYNLIQLAPARPQTQATTSAQRKTRKQHVRMAISIQ